MENQRIERIVESDRELTEKISNFKRYLATEGNCCQVSKCLKPFYPHIDENFTSFSKVDWHKVNIDVRGYTGSYLGDVNVCYSCAYVECTRDYGFHTINKDKVIQ